MIDASEPKNGDFVAYVEQFVRLPQGMVVPPELRSPGQALGRGGFAELAKRLEQGAVRSETRGGPGAADGTNSPPWRPSWIAKSSPESDGDTARVAAPGAIAPAGSAWGHSTDGRAPARGGAVPRSPAPAGPPDLDQLARTAARALARLGRRFASILLFAGLALLALSFADQDFIPIDPVPGVGLVAAGAILRRIASKVA